MNSKRNRNITESKIYQAFYKYAEENSVLDYDYFIDIYLPKQLNIITLDSEIKLKQFISNNKKLFNSIKSKCLKTLDTSAKQNAISYIKEFGKGNKDKVIINIIRDEKENT